MKVSITITADVDADRIPSPNDPDEDAEARFLRWLVSRRTEGPVLEIKLSTKRAFSIYPEPAGKQLPMLDFLAKVREEEEEDEDELEPEAADVD